MRHLFETDLPQAYGLTKTGITVDISKHSGRFALYDADRCAGCKTVLKKICNRENILIEAKSDVLVACHESYLKQFGEKSLGKGKRCDYFLADDSDAKSKVAFCELTCAIEDTIEPNEERKYLPEGKRAKAMKQLEDSVKRFTSKEVSKSYLSTFPVRHCIFGWRDPFSINATAPQKRGDLEANMKIMGMATSGSETILLQKQQIDDMEFVFYQVKYPSIYIW